MIEINSNKIEKNLFENEIENIINIYIKNPLKKRELKKRSRYDGLKPSVKEYISKSYIYLKKLEQVFHTLGFSKLPFLEKKVIKKDAYIVSDFNQYNGEVFIRNIYLTVLKREVDLLSLEYYLSQLMSGKKSKTEILSSIRFSKEGRAKNVNILGIKKRYILTLLYKIPILGYIVKVFVAILRLPKILEKTDSFEAYCHEKLSDFQSQIDAKVNLSDFHKDMHMQNISIKDGFLNADKKLDLYISDINKIKNYIKMVENNLDNLIKKAENSIVTQCDTDKADFLQSIVKEKEHVLDLLYVSFENKFRGSRQDIKTRQVYYVPYIKKTINSKEELVVDIGCGRGEWLEVLKENDIKAKGIDLNRLMVEEAIEYGLDAEYMDAIDYLSGLKDESTSVVTGFHIAEHLPFRALVSLLDESLRVLKKGGMIILETPNPENIMVGACSFYTDPTHINPIPPATLEFLATHRGFQNVEIHRLHPVKKPSYIKGENMEDINNLIFSSVKEQDYSIIGYKI